MMLAKMYIVIICNICYDFYITKIEETKMSEREYKETLKAIM